MSDAGDETVSEARARVEANATEGITCPVCGRLVKVYVRRIHREMVVFMARLQRACDQYREIRYFTPREILGEQSKASTDAVYALHWGLIEREPREATEAGEEPPEPKRGHYRITQRGRDFLAGHTKEARAVFILCGKVIGFDTTQYLTVDDAYDATFRYADILFTVPE